MTAQPSTATRTIWRKGLRTSKAHPRTSITVGTDPVVVGAGPDVRGGISVWIEHTPPVDATDLLGMSTMEFEVVGTGGVVPAGGVHRGMVSLFGAEGNGFTVHIYEIAAVAAAADAPDEAQADDGASDGQGWGSGSL